MVLEIKQSLKLSQQLVMTPQLQQAIKLLQLNRLELVNVIQQEMMENPTLEEEVDLTEEEKKEIEKETERAKKEEEYQTTDKSDTPEDTEWDSYLQISAANRQGLSTGIVSDEELPSYEATLSKKPSLTEHLLSQVGFTDFSDEEKIIASEIVGNLNDDGFLMSSVEEIAVKHKIPLERVEMVLYMLQELDPPGVCARNLRECLLIQIRQLKLKNQRDKNILCAMIDRHLSNLEKRNYREIAKDLGVSKERIVDLMKVISSLEPKPGRPFADSNNHYITPDIYVYKVVDEYVIALNEDGLPRLRISNFYRNILQRGGSSQLTKEYIHNKLRSAVWLIRSIHQRQRTIYKVTESIVKHQRTFLDKGVEYLKPMILRDVAEDINMHESTVSRVTTNKYVHTPQGIFELKYFFSSSINRGEGEGVAAESVKDRIRQIITKEGTEKPFSDQYIVNQLEKEGIQIARRTVAKYREMLGILPSSKRKRRF